MKKQTLKCLLALVLALASVASCSLYILAEENPNPDNKMAYNIYSEPQFGEVPQAFVTYSIDMRSDQAAPITYWSLANFSMYISEATKKKYNQIEGGGCYAGIQTHGADAPRKAIMAFWEWHYWPNGAKPSAPIGTNSDGTQNWGETNLTAKRIYPAGKQSDFGGEGEGTNWITNYGWKDSQWYRMVLHTWDNPSTGTTYCGQWLCDLTTGKWTLISYFDTMMYNSYLTGNMHFFMENFVGGEPAAAVRDVKMKNIYVQRYDNKQWESISSTKLMHCDDWAKNKIGKHTFGATEEYFWATSGSYLDEGVDQKQYDAEWPAQVFTISQPAQPTFGDPSFKDIKIRERNGSWTAQWFLATDSTPQFSYTLKVKDENGKVLQSFAATKPEENHHVLDEVKTDIFTCEMTMTDIFGKTTSFVKGSPAYIEKYGEVTGGTPNTTGDNGSNMGLIIGIAAGAVALVAVAGVSVMVAQKAKKKKF